MREEEGECLVPTRGISLFKGRKWGETKMKQDGFICSDEVLFF